MTAEEWIAYKEREIRRNMEINCPYVAERHRRELEDFFREQEENSNFINKQVEAYEEVFLCKCEGFGNGQE